MKCSIIIIVRGVNWKQKGRGRLESDLFLDIAAVAAVDGAFFEGVFTNNIGENRMTAKKVSNE